MIFTSFGYQVQLYDVNSDCLSQAKGFITQELEKLCSSNGIRGTKTLSQRLALISTADSLGACIADSIHIQECVFEDQQLKQKVFQEIDQLLPADNKDTSICSSTSVQLPSSVFSLVTKHRDQCLVAHPINPPLHVRLVELVSMKETRRDILEKTRALMAEVGQKPVILHKEISGFALNRLQYAVFQEAFRLVHDDVMSPEDVDTVVTAGLGPRYAFIGPWMTAHLNAVGMQDYLDRYNEGIWNVSKECQPLLRIEGEAAKKIVNSMNNQVPLNKLGEKRAWRDKCLLELARVKDSVGDQV